MGLAQSKSGVWQSECWLQRRGDAAARKWSTNAVFGRTRAAHCYRSSCDAAVAATRNEATRGDATTVLGWSGADRCVSKRANTTQPTDESSRSSRACNGGRRLASSLRHHTQCARHSRARAHECAIAIASRSVSYDWWRQQRNDATTTAAATDDAAATNDAATANDATTTNDAESTDDAESADDAESTDDESDDATEQQSDDGSWQLQQS